MRLLLILVLAAGLAWSGYWAFSATAIDRGLASWLDARRAEGWVAEAAGIETAGYPARFETRLGPVELVDPDTGLAWEAPEFRFAADAHRPNRIAAVWPATQAVASPYERIDVTSQTMRAALSVRPGTALELIDGDMELAAVRLVSDAGWEARIAEGGLTARRTEADDPEYEVAFSAGGVNPGQPVLDRLDPAGLLPEVFESLRIEATLGFDRPWDRRAIEERRPQPRAIDLAMLDARWGDLALEAAGTLDVDAEGIPSGEITVRATNWRDMLEVARASGALSEELLPTVTRALEFLAALSGSPETIDAPLSFRRGLVLIGPIPVGPAPRIVLR